ncbi:MAG TPA: transglycosylase SLT domain-containing protein [Pseudolysinimonas sp.]
MLLTKAMVIHYAITCGHVDPDVAAMMAITAWKESRFETTAISPPNRDGTRDFGPYQINAKNLAPLGLTEQTALDPCEASRAAATWFKVLSVYNTGTERAGILNGYAGDTYAHRHDAGGVPVSPPHAAEPDTTPEPVRGAQQILVFDGWSKE